MEEIQRPIRSTATGVLGNYQYELLDSPTSTTPHSRTSAMGVFRNLIAGDYYVKSKPVAIV